MLVKILSNSRGVPEQPPNIQAHKDHQNTDIDSFRVESFLGLRIGSYSGFLIQIEEQPLIFLDLTRRLSKQTS